MKKNLTIIIGLFLWTGTVFGQEPLDVTEQTIKIGGLKEEELYFGFAAGDKIVFSFQEADNKEMKEIEIVEYPNNSKFSDYKSKRIENKTINVTKTGVYVFRFKNSAIAGRICKIKIQRIPANDDTKNFNSTVTWINKQDTTWNTYTKDVTIGYDTTYVQKTKRELVKTEQKEELIFDKTQRVHSSTNSNGNKTNVFFTLPKNETSPYKTTKVISWAYWVGVDEAGNKAWEQNSKTVSNLAKGAAAMYLTPLGALALGAVTDLAVPSVGEDVEYWIADQSNAQLFMTGNAFRMYDKGKGVAGFKRFTDASLCQGTFYILLYNDNVMQGINANIKVVAIVETNIYEDKQYTEQVVTPRTEKQMFKDPVITTKRIPITGQ
ncbi:MAG: hypothetical protein QY303_04340 [Vicingaceae bacterium]|nr:MAG: hypothetical protein QY303_04340 [Vicingaceae bacterium]